MVGMRLDVFGLLLKVVLNKIQDTSVHVFIKFDLLEHVFSSLENLRSRC